MHRRIKVIYVGGTLGMVPSADGQGFAPGADIPGALARLVEESGLDLHYDLHVFDRLIDSAQTTPREWQAMADDIQAGVGSYGGFVVLHGTDTLAFTACALAFALTDVSAPIVLTGAQRSIIEPDSDTPANIVGALTAASADWSGVGVFFGDVLLAGPRATKVSTVRPHGFASPDAEPRARMRDAEWAWAAPPPAAAGWPSPAPYRAHDVAVITCTPGISPARMRAAVTPRPEAVLIRAYGTGQAPGNDGATYDLVRELVDAGVPVAVTTQSGHGPVDLTRYAAGERLLHAGAHGTGDMTFEAAYTKLMFLLSQDVEAADISRWMATDLAGEVTPV